MPLFVCDTCKAIDNTAFGGYWDRKIAKMRTPDTRGKALCWGCREGDWHNAFPKEIATPELLDEMGRENFVHTAGMGSARNPCAGQG